MAVRDGGGGVSANLHAKMSPIVSNVKYRKQRLGFFKGLKPAELLAGRFCALAGEWWGEGGRQIRAGHIMMVAAAESNCV